VARLSSDREELVSEHDTFDRLLNAMPRIAESINSFTSDEVQRAAFDALMTALQLPNEQKEAAADVEDASGVEIPLKSPIAGSESVANGEQSPKPRRAKRSASKKNFSIVRDLNFAPNGKQSLEEFVTDKKPKNQHEKNLIACFYLDEIMGIENITVGHVLSVYSACRWTSPSHPDTSLQATASANNWLDTSDMGSITVVWAGKNYVTRMPVESK